MYVYHLDTVSYYDQFNTGEMKIDVREQKKAFAAAHSTYASYVGSVFVKWHAPQSSNVYKFRMCVQDITCHITVLKGKPAKQNCKRSAHTKKKATTNLNDSIFMVFLRREPAISLSTEHHIMFNVLISILW